MVVVERNATCRVCGWRRARSPASGTAPATTRLERCCRIRIVGKPHPVVPRDLLVTSLLADPLRQEDWDVEQLDRVLIDQSVGERLTFGAGLTGQTEGWRKWSPADSLIECSDDLAWVDVRKTVIKRRFRVDGEECVSAGDPALMTAGGVDVEVVAVTVEGAEAWTFAFAAFGPPSGRCSAIVSASEALFAGKGVTELGLLSDRSGGYPDWLVHVVHGRAACRYSLMSASQRAHPAEKIH